MPAKMKLTEMNLLRLFNSPDYEHLLKDFTTQRFSKKRLVYSPFEEKNLIFIVKSGKLRVYLACEDKEFTLAFLEVNDAAVRHYGYSRAEFLSMTIMDILPPEDAPGLHHDARPAAPAAPEADHRRPDPLRRAGDGLLKIS